jgi:hypothetical protein
MTILRRLFSPPPPRRSAITELLEYLFRVDEPDPPFTMGPIGGTKSSTTVTRNNYCRTDKIALCVCKSPRFLCGSVPGAF